jgi:chemotaxis protein MotB
MSGPAKTETGPAEERAPGYLQDVAAAMRRPIGDAWMVTFADLVALMLTFFVLMFAMSHVERYKWQSLVRSLAGSLDSIRSVDDAKPAIAFQIDQDAPVPGTDLNYLAPLILRRTEADPALSDGIVRHNADRVVLSLPADVLFDPGATDIPGRAGQTIYAIGSLLRTLDNRAEVHGHVSLPAGHTGADGGGGRSGSPQDPTGWGMSLARAAAVAAALAEVGYDRPMVVRGFGDVSHDAPPSDLDKARRARFADRIDIVILDSDGGGS